MITKQELKEFSKTNLDFAQDCFIENENSFLLMVIILAVKDNKKILITKILNADEVENRLAYLAEMGIDLGVKTIITKEYDSIDAIFMISEAWMSKQEGGKDKFDKKLEDGEILMPSKDPNKMEVLISSGCSSDNLAVSEFKIIRRLLTSNGKVEIKFEDLKELKDKDGKNEEPIEVKSPLLEEFWKAFNFVKNKTEKEKLSNNLQKNA
mgnify:CR=1 FL=1